MASFSPGPDGRLYVLVCMGEPDTNWVTRYKACDWRILAFDSRDWSAETLIENQIANFGHVQPLLHGIVLATMRCKYAGDATEPNGYVYDGDGHLAGKILFGDGIADLQTTKRGDIWVSYFDEGIFGSLGWDKPVGSPGLVRFDKSGNIRFRFEPVAGLDSMVDCYCLNVVSEREAWCYYYEDFAVVQVCDDRVKRYWTCPISGSSGLALWHNTALMQGGYKSNEWRLLKLADEEAVANETAFTFRTPDGRPLNAGIARCRNSAVWFVEGEEIYIFDLREAQRVMLDNST